MVPHERCQRHGCWLQSFAQLKGTRSPQFQLFQVVEMTWFDGEGNCWRYHRGEVVGYVVGGPGLLLPGWWYFVRLTYNDYPWLPSGYVKEVHESELRLVS